MKDEMRKKLGISEDKPSDWFEELYAKSDEGGEGVPWANLAPHKLFKEWVDRDKLVASSKKALVVGCGLGDDAIQLEAKGYQVTAFDISKSAIDLCKKRFPNSAVNFVTKDLLEGIPEWNSTFDLVLEIYTVQALPPKYEDTLIKNIAGFVAKGGRLVVVAVVKNKERNFEDGPPWPLDKRSYTQAFERYDLKKVSRLADTEIDEELHLTVFEK